MSIQQGERMSLAANAAALGSRRTGAWLWLGITLGLAWAVIFFIPYFWVDNGYFFDYFRLYAAGTAVKAALASLVLLSLGVLVGYAASQRGRRPWLLGALSAAAIGLAAWVLWPRLLATLRSLGAFPDGLQVTLLLAGVGLVGVGLGLGMRLSQRPLPLWFLAAVIGLPLLLITLRAGALASALGLLWLILAAHGLGVTLLGWLNRLATPATLARAGLVSLAVGLAALILGTLGLGLLGGSSALGLLSGLLLVTLLCIRPILAALRRLATLPWREPCPLTTPALTALLMLAALFCVYWVAALAPEVGADALGFRVAGPAIWLRAGRLQPLPEMLGSYGQMAGETLYLLALPLAGLSAAKLVQVGLAAALVVSAFMQVFPAHQRRDVALWVFAFWGGTVVWTQMAWGFVDLAQMFFYYAALLALRLWLDEPDRPIWVMAAGLAAATATTIKINGAGALLTVGLIVAGVTWYRSHSWRPVVQFSCFWGLPAALGLLPWLLRSYVLTGNPIFPFANELFRSPLASLDLTAARVGVGLKFPDILAVPWSMNFEQFAHGSLGAYHPWLLAGAVVSGVGLVWAARKDWLWLGAGALAFLTWLVTEQNTRYSLYAGYLLALAFGLGLAQVCARLSRPLARAAFQWGLLAALLVGFTVEAGRPTFWMGRNSSGPAFPTRVVLGAQPEAEYLSVHVPTYPCAQWLNHHYGRQAKVWLVPPLRDHLYFAAQTFALPHGILPDTQPLIELLRDPALNANPAAAHQQLVTAGYTHLVYHADNSGWVGPIEAERQGVFSPAFTATYLRLECADRGLRLYAVLPAPLLAPPQREAGPDVLANAGFEALDENGQPAGWTLAGQAQVVDLVGNHVFRLESAATLAQTAPVADERLYELTAEYRSSAVEPSGYLQILWLDAAGQPRLFWRQTVIPTRDWLPYRLFQTVPVGVQSAVLYVEGSGFEIDNIHLREFHP